MSPKSPRLYGDMRFTYIDFSLFHWVPACMWWRLNRSFYEKHIKKIMAHPIVIEALHDSHGSDIAVYPDKGCRNENWGLVGRPIKTTVSAGRKSPGAQMLWRRHPGQGDQRPISVGKRKKQPPGRPRRVIRFICRCCPYSVITYMPH